MAFYIVIIIFVASLVHFFFKKAQPKINIGGKLALISGGSNGLGQSTCIELAKEGCNIAFCDISPTDDTLEKLKAFNVKVKAYKTDVSNFNDVLKLRDDVHRDFNCDVDILINNAALIPYKTIFDQSYEEIEKLTAVNINSVYMMTKCFLERMKLNSNGGHIVSISSLQGIYAFPHSLLYCSTKFAVTGFMLGLKEFLRIQKIENIHTTQILPNVIASRKDLIEQLNDKVVSFLKPTDIGMIVKDAIVYRKSFVTIPTYYSVMISIFNCLPFSLQAFIRDLQNEKNFMNQN